MSEENDRMSPDHMFENEEVNPGRGGDWGEAGQASTLPGFGERGGLGSAAILSSEIRIL